jgi:uncharacterized membrane protein
MKIDSLRHTRGFELAYKIGVTIKGFDGAVELLAGIALLISPTIVHDMLTAVVGKANEHAGVTAHFVSEYVARLDADLARSGLTFLIVFLIGHGVIKLILVYCLLRRILWAYPYALGALVLFLVYQLYVVAQDPGSVGLWLLTLLDVAIIWLVWGEWKDLKEEAATTK